MKVHSTHTYDHIPAVKWPHLLKFSLATWSERLFFFFLKIALQHFWSLSQRFTAELTGSTSKRLTSPRILARQWINITLMYDTNLALIMQLILCLQIVHVAKLSAFRHLSIFSQQKQRCYSAWINFLPWQKEWIICEETFCADALQWIRQKYKC